MVSVSLMAPGEAAHTPPPLLPDHASLANYTMLFARLDMARYFANSPALAILATLLFLSFNVTAGSAFAKLPFRRRHRLFRLLLDALVLPAQVAMIPLVLLFPE